MTATVLSNAALEKKKSEVASGPAQPEFSLLMPIGAPAI